MNPLMFCPNGDLINIFHTNEKSNSRPRQWASPPPLRQKLHIIHVGPRPLANTLILGSIPLTSPNGILIQSAVFPQISGQTDAHTDTQTDRKIVDGTLPACNNRPLTLYRTKRRGLIITRIILIDDSHCVCVCVCV